MIISIIYYVIGGIIVAFAKLIGFFSFPVVFTQSIYIILIEVGKWNYIFPLYAIFKSIAAIVLLEVAFFIYNQVMSFLRLLRGGG